MWKMALASLLLCVMMITPARSFTGRPHVHLNACALGKAHLPARCGSLAVYEGSARRTRLIHIHIELLPAMHPHHQAIAIVPGGPGEAASTIAPMVADGVLSPELLKLRDRYDLLFVDFRGMGLSNPFDCNFTPIADPRSYFLQLWPDPLVRKCRAAATHHSDPALYNTQHAVDDLDTIRAALGYEKLVLDGGSYGTFFSFVYMRRYPSHVESAVLSGVYAPGFQPLPGAPGGAQHALDDLVRRCRSDKRCNTHFPHFEAHFYDVIRRFNARPVRMPLIVNGRTHMVRLSKEVLVDRVRQALYDPQNAAYIPVVFEHAYHGDYAPLSDLVNGMSLALARALDWGAFLSYTCADEVPFISASAMNEARTDSFVGDLRARAQQHACHLWNVPSMPETFNDPVTSSVPVLMIMGSDDPSTPPKFAEKELPYLTNATAVVVHGAGHTTETACTDRLVARFIRARSGKGLSASVCQERYVPPAFALRP